MKQIEISRPGGPEVLVLADGPEPKIAGGEVLIRVHAAGVNRADLMQRQGHYPPPPGASPLLGMEVSGEIAAVAGDVSTWKVGDRVCALLAGGGYAEFAAAPAPQCLPLPANISFVEGAAVPEAFFTVWTNVFERGRLQSGEWFLVHGGASGIGTTAIQLAKNFGAPVIATAGTDEKCRACEALGADAAINYRAADFVAEASRLTGGKGVDVILDIIGGSYTPRNIAALAVEGRLVQIGLQEGSSVQIDLRPVMMRRLTLTGSTLRGRTVAQKGDIARALHEHVWPLLESGRVRPVIDREFPLADAAAAHRYLESGEHIGKVVLKVRA
jgi:putative PIG3 family NAD(P)H quinone oxidoreductase